MRILLIEDDPHIGDGIAAGLKKLGMAADWFTDGRQGQAALTAAPYDAVVLDLGLPGIDGMDILRHWRQQGWDTPALVLTARDALPDRLPSGFAVVADEVRKLAEKTMAATREVERNVTGIRDSAETNR